MARLDIAERRVPAGRPHQDAAVEEPRHRLPRQHLPHAVRREGRAAYPGPDSAKLGIDVLGYEDFQRKLYLDALAKPYGMILVTGPHRQRQDRVPVYRPQHPEHRGPQHLHREDPVEINVPGINQVNVNPKVG